MWNFLVCLIVYDVIGAIAAFGMGVAMVYKDEDKAQRFLESMVMDRQGQTSIETLLGTALFIFSWPAKLIWIYKLYRDFE